MYAKHATASVSTYFGPVSSFAGREIQKNWRKPQCFRANNSAKAKRGVCTGYVTQKNAIKMELQSIFDKLEASKNDEKSLFLFRNAD